jgi:hypothetical protein
MARDPLKPYREAGAALVGEVQERLAARSVATRADIARLEARIDALERASRKAGTKKAGPKKAGPKKAGPKEATQPRSSR